MTPRGRLARLTTIALVALSACTSPTPDRRGPAADALDDAHRTVQTALLAQTDGTPSDIPGRATALLAPLLEPHRAELRARARWQLDALPRLDLDLSAYRDKVPEAQIDVSVELIRAELGDAGGDAFWTLMWDPVRIAAMVRTMAMFRALSIEEAARRVSVDNLAPPSIRLASDDIDAPIVALLSGPEAFVVSLAWKDGAYLPIRVRWLTRDVE